MTGAPERIWATVNGHRTRFHMGGEAGGYEPALIGGWTEHPDTGRPERARPEYIRADLIPAMLADARRQALEEAMRACLEESGETPPKSYADEHGHGWFDGAQACADAIGDILAEDAE